MSLLGHGRCICYDFGRCHCCVVGGVSVRVLGVVSVRVFGISHLLGVGGISVSESCQGVASVSVVDSVRVWEVSL